MLRNATICLGLAGELGLPELRTRSDAEVSLAGLGRRESAAAS